MPSPLSAFNLRADLARYWASAAFESRSRCPRDRSRSRGLSVPKRGCGDEDESFESKCQSAARDSCPHGASEALEGKNKLAVEQESLPDLQRPDHPVVVEEEKKLNTTTDANEILEASASLELSENDKGTESDARISHGSLQTNVTQGLEFSRDAEGPESNPATSYGSLQLNVVRDTEFSIDAGGPESNPVTSQRSSQVNVIQDLEASSSDSVCGVSKNGNAKSVAAKQEKPTGGPLFGGTVRIRFNTKAIANNTSAGPADRLWMAVREQSRDRGRKSTDCHEIDLQTSGSRECEATKIKMNMAQKQSQSRGKNWDVRPGDMLCKQEDVLSGLKSRIVFVGNVPQNSITSEILKSAFVQLFNLLPQFIRDYSPGTDPVHSVDLRKKPQHYSFAHVRFIDSTLASTAVEMSGFRLFGTPLIIRRIHGCKLACDHVLDVQPLRDAGGLASLAQTFRFTALFVGNLPTGTTQKALYDLFAPTCIELPEYRADAGSPILSVAVVSKSSCAFVDFQNWELAGRILERFDGTYFQGKQIRLRRRNVM